MNIEHHPLKGGTGSMSGGGNKLVLHTTESPREWIDGAIAQFTAGDGTPHLSIGWRKGLKFPVVAQFLPFDQFAKTLEHPGGTPETNRADAVQVEICGRAAESHDWDENWYRALSNMALLVQHRTRFPIRAPRRMPGTRYTGPGWIKASGIVGHCHAPNQRQGHSDPGRLRVFHLAHLMQAGRQELKARGT